MHIPPLRRQRRTRGEDTVVAAKGLVKPTVEVYPLAQANDARDQLDAGKVRYRAVLAHA